MPESVTSSIMLWEDGFCKKNIYEKYVKKYVKKLLTKGEECVILLMLQKTK